MTGENGSNGPVVVEHTLGHIRTLTLNRPEARNAMSPEVVCRLANGWVRAADDDRIRVVIITGVGPVFCAGADLRLLVPLLAGDRSPEDEWDERVRSDDGILHRAVLRDRVCDKPIIAAVNGPVTAGGMELVLGTDLRVAADTATFGLAEARRGLIPGGGGLSRLPRQVPLAFALELLLTGRSVPAEVAAGHGLVNLVCPPETVIDRAMELGRSIADNGPMAVAEIVRVVRQADGLPLAKAMTLEAEAFDRVLQSEDAIEGPKAFIEGRAPRFVGR